MKKSMMAVLLISYCYIGYGQAYIPMPSDSGATWRYRIYDIDYITHIFDFIIFLNGKDTAAIGNIYHQLTSRGVEYVVPNGFDPPIMSLNAGNEDIYFGAIRESGKKVYSLNSTATGEDLIYDFNAGVGDTIPIYSGGAQVTAIDSVLLSGTYHKRCLTADTGYYTIEGVGSSRGLIPQLNDGSGNVAFYCFTSGPVFYSPDTALPCTYIYPLGYSTGLAKMNADIEVNIFPVPAEDVLHIQVTQSMTIDAKSILTNCLGQIMWSGNIDGSMDMDVHTWPRGIYYFRYENGNRVQLNKKIVLE